MQRNAALSALANAPPGVPASKDESDGPRSYPSGRDGQPARPGPLAGAERCDGAGLHTKATDLIAGRTIDAGNVNVCNDATTLTVTYEATYPWCLVETNLHVATSVSDIPQNSNGVPTPDRFDDGDNHVDCPGTATFEIPLADIGGGVSPGDSVVIAVHAEVDDGERQEGAWGAGTRLVERGPWATYFTCTTREPSLYVSVTSTTHNGNLGGLAGADAICNDRATEQSLPGAGNYKAWLSVAGAASPSTRFDQTAGPYVLVDGTTQVAAGWADLTDGELHHTIDMTEDAGGPLPHDFVWTGTRPDGTPDPNSDSCQGWTDNTPTFPTQSTGLLGRYAIEGTPPTRWTESDYAACHFEARLYCFQQP